MSDNRDVCPRHELLETTLVRIEATTREGFAGVNRTLGEVAKDLREGAVTMTELRTRVNHLEKWLYTAMTSGIAGLITALLALLLRK